MADRKQAAIAVVSAEAVVWLQDRPASGTKLYAEPLVDLSEVPRYVLTHYGDESTMIESPRGAWVRLSDVETVIETPAAPWFDLHANGMDQRVNEDTFAAAIRASRSQIGPSRPDDDEPEEQWLWDKLSEMLGEEAEVA